MKKGGYRIVFMDLYPEYKGALIIAENAGAAIKLEITNAVSALTGLTSDKITVVAGS